METGWKVERGSLTATALWEQEQIKAPRCLVVERLGYYYRCRFPVLSSAAERRANQGLVMEKKCPCSGYVFCQHDAHLCIGSTFLLGWKMVGSDTVHLSFTG